MDPYIPSELPIPDLDYKSLFGLVGQANAALARYDGLLQGITNPVVMLSPLTTQEAVLSSKIEGTQATIDEVLEQEAGLIKSGEKEKDIQEISNYRSALLRASDYLKSFPISLSMIQDIHKVLLDSVRGKDKNPGEFRKDQNWIGKYGSPMDEATFIPPNPIRMPDFLNDWVSYIQHDDIDHLLQTAVVHAQFELIHPFKDGNGRIGRMLIPLFLYFKKKLSQPMFYLSEFLEANREEYYACLKGISAQGDWNSWIKFFLGGLIEQAEANSARVEKIMKLFEAMKSKIGTIIHSQYNIYLLDALFERPIFSTSDIAKRLNERHQIHVKTASGYLRQLKEAGILQELEAGSGSRSAVLCFPELINIAEGKKIF